MEEAVSPQTLNSAGFEPTRIRQFTVFLDNRVGRLQSLVRTLEEAKTRIVALTIEESGDTALVRLICSDADVGRQTLAAANFAFGEGELLAVELPQQTRQPMIQICSALLTAEINIHYCYPFLQRPHGPTLALYVEDITLAAQILIRKGFKLIGESDLKEKP